MKSVIETAFMRHLQVFEMSMEALLPDIERACETAITTLKTGNKILLFGNGGSAADAQHIAAELTGRYQSSSRRGLPAIALTTDSSALTSIGNDFGFEQLFSRQVEALASSGDMLIGISTSGNSSNVLAALEQGGDYCTSIGLSGNGGGEMQQLCDINIVVPSTETPRIQEMHILIGHILCEMVDRHFSS
ncbi:MAG: D-sedoheptulose 7-phosphate isomerase [Pseudomonadota bacterium]